MNNNTGSGAEEQLSIILGDADKLLSICGTDYDDVTEYQEEQNDQQIQADDGG